MIITKKHGRPLIRLIARFARAGHPAPLRVRRTIGVKAFGPILINPPSLSSKPLLVTFTSLPIRRS